ncbi:MAG: hypothetical protein IT243_11225 [Bacteroidia bacterium]|nr:hypothetical protein [Bacteroidia bacterium]
MKNKVLFLGTIIFIFSACSISKYSNKTKKEETSMNIADDQTFLATASNNQPLARGVKSRGLITLAMLEKLTSVGADAVKKIIDKEKKKYIAEYSDGLSNLYFYSHLSENNTWDPEGIQFKEFTFIRTFKNKSGKIDTAIKVTFMLDTSKSYEIYNNATFRLKVKDIEINYAKAKIPTKKWYMPWSYLQKGKNDKLDLDIEVNFYTTYNTKEGTINKDVTLGTFYLLIRDAPLSKKDKNYNSYYDSLSKEVLDGYSYIVPRSFGHYYDGNEYKPCYSQGNYSIVIKITESGKEKFVDKIIMNNSNKFIDVISEQVKKIK